MNKKILVYYRNQYGYWQKTGEAHTRLVHVQGRLPDGSWSDPLAPMRRREAVELIEDAIARNGKFLSCEAYRLVEVPSQLTEADRARLRQLHKAKEAAK